MEHINANGCNLARCNVTQPFFLCLSENIACKSLHKVIVRLLTTPKMYVRQIQHMITIRLKHGFTQHILLLSGDPLASHAPFLFNLIISNQKNSNMNVQLLQ